MQDDSSGEGNSIYGEKGKSTGASTDKAGASAADQPRAIEKGGAKGESARKKRESNRWESPVAKPQNVQGGAPPTPKPSTGSDGRERAAPVSTRRKISLRRGETSPLKNQHDTIDPLFEPSPATRLQGSRLQERLKSLDALAEVPCLAIYRLAERELVLTWQQGFAPQFLMKFSWIRLEPGWVSKLAEVRSSVKLSPEMESEALPAREGLRHLGITDHEWVILRDCGGEVLGLLLLGTKGGSGPGLNRGDLMQVIAEKVGRAVEVDRLQYDLQNLREKNKALELQLVQAQKMKSVGTLASCIAHDFNNILSGIIGYLSLIKSQTDRDSPFYQDLERIESSADRASHLTSRLLAVGREATIERKPVCLNSIVEEVVHLLSGTLDRKITIKRKLARSLPDVIGDSTQLQEVILNICINAREAMPRGGSLTITTRGIASGKIPKDKGLPSHPQGYVLLSVRDTGMGMSPETKKKLFEPFFTTKKNGGGSGLGLALAHSVVRQHRGCIEVQSEPNRGTEFNIYLPAGTGSESPTPGSRHETKRGTESILLVDDDRVIRELTAEILERRGYTVIKAADGGEAAHNLRTCKDGIDLVILDLAASVSECEKICQRLRQLHPGIRLLFTSGCTERVSLPASPERSGTGFIHKPYRAEELLSKVREILKMQAAVPPSS
jgi:signal transduction histidine kinase/ActR/RegA family two-component response regulator